MKKKVLFVSAFLLFLSVHINAQDMYQCLGSYNYTDMWSDTNMTMYANASTQPYCLSGTYNGQNFNHYSGSNITITSPNGRASSFSGNYSYNGLVSLPFWEGEYGQVSACGSHNNWCTALAGPYMSPTFCMIGAWGYSEEWFGTVSNTYGEFNCQYISQCPDYPLNCRGPSSFYNKCSNKYIKQITDYTYIFGVRKCQTPKPPIYSGSFFGSCQNIEGPPN